MPPLLVAEQLTVVPGLSVLRLVGAHAVEMMAESGSVTIQDTVTSEVYHPLSPKVPRMYGVTVGGVSSAGSGDKVVK